MNEDAELLSRYATERSETAFAALAQRHLDLVYSAALRLMHGNVHSAQDVTQQVFVELARQATRLARHPTLVGWLYTTTRWMALRAQRTEQRRQTREQEAHAMTELLHDEPPSPDWTQLSPVIEDALHALGEQDRAAILLRFFQNKSLSEVGAGLHLTENAARMRVTRALDKLRDQLARRGITTTAAALAALVSANAIQAAPAGLATTVSAAAVAGSALGTSALITASKTIAMTALQKTVVTTALVLAAGTGIYAVRQSSQLHHQIQALEQERAPLAAQLQALEHERNQATNQLATLKEEMAHLKSGQDAAELLKLRGQVGALRQQAAASEGKANLPAGGLAKLMNDPAMKQYLRQAQMEKIRSMYADLFKELKLTPEQTSQFLEVFTERASKGLASMVAAAQGTPTPTATEPAKSLESQLQAVLGEAGLARFKEYSDEIPARSTIGLLNTQLGDNTLNPEQTARLLQVIKAEPSELTQGVTGAPDKAFLGSQAEIDTFLARVAESNQRIVQQAASFLSADQATALNTVLTNAITTRQLQAAALLQKR